MPRTARRQSPHELVNFARPPVAEVVLAAQFPPETIDLEVYGRFARELRDGLPRRTRQGLVPRNEEKFDQRRVQPSFEIRFEGPADLPRIVFESENRVELVQLQPHRLTLNWRKVTPDAVYPRYKTLRKRFRKLLDLLAGALDELDQRHPVELSEVTYVNPIEYPGDAATDPVGRTHPDPANIINRFKHRPRNAFLPEAEDAHLQARWRIADPAGEPVGRLHLSMEPGLRPPRTTPGDLEQADPASDLTPIYLVNLTARVMPARDTVDRAMKALDLAHEWVVLGFEDLTTATMHDYWGLAE
ncbi:MAG: TIGR04255 family protein [Solirubrobacterales bacterium]